MKVEFLKKAFGLGEFSKREIERRKINEKRKSILNKAVYDTQLISIENEKNPIFIDIFNKIINGEFKNAKDTNFKGFYKCQKGYKILLDNSDLIDVCQGYGMGPGFEGAEDGSGDYINFWFILINDKKIGGNGYITYDSYSKIINKIKEFNNF